MLYVKINQLVFPCKLAAEEGVANAEEDMDIDAVFAELEAETNEEVAAEAAAAAEEDIDAIFTELETEARRRGCRGHREG